MKKRFVGGLVLLVLLFGFFYHSVNAGKPRDIEIKKYGLNEEINFNDTSIFIKNFDLTKRKSDNLNLLKVTFCIKNNRKESVNIGNYLYGLVFFNGYDESVPQNIDPPEDLKNLVDNDYEKSYSDKDFIIGGNETKDFVFYYMIDDMDNFKKDPSCLLISNSAYFDLYQEKLKDGTFYYEIIEVGKNL